MPQPSPSTDPIRLLTTRDAARLADRAEGTIRLWAITGRLEVACRTESGVRLYRREDVIRAAAATTRPAPAVGDDADAVGSRR